MSSFEETIARMKGLYTYGKELNENNNFNTHTLEYHAIGADGKSYGIIKECNKYYIKTAPQAKEMVAEAYDYIGGFCNRKSYEYNSYASALKNFEMKLASINEAFDGNVNISTLDPFKKEEYIVEGTRKMQDEIARCRQIMYNAAMIMNESIEGIGAKKVGDVVKNDTKSQPEAPKGGKVDSVTKGTAAGTPKENPSAGKSGNKPGKDGVYTEKPKGIKEGKCCEKCGKEQCTCKNCNEESGDIGDNPLMPNTENWGTEGIGKGRDPKSVGWEMDGQKNVNEETDEWDEGLPASAGIGDADNSHNNDPFNKSINEEDEEDFNDAEGEEYTDDVEGGEGGDDMSTDTDFDAGLDDEYSDGEGDDFSDEGDDFSDEGDDFSDEGDEFGDEESGSIEISNDDDIEGGEDGDLQSQIDALRAQIEQLQAQLDGSDTSDDFSDEGDDFSDEGDDFSDEGDDFSDEGDEFSDEGDEFADGGDEFADGGDEFSDGGEDYSDGGDEYSDGGDEYSDGGDEYSDEENNEIDECGAFQNQMMEAKRRKMNKIIESVTKRILKEEELHDFGKHPGYRKKPMELPTTGEDKNQWGEDWNDESVHSEEPFGSKIGNGDPFNKLVQAITKDVMYQLKKGIPIEGENKKKEE